MLSSLELSQIINCLFEIIWADFQKNLLMTCMAFSTEIGTVYLYKTLCIALLYSYIQHLALMLSVEDCSCCSH